MPFVVPIDEAQAQFPEFRFIEPLTPSEQKAAFHVQNAENQDLCLKIIAPTYSIDRLSLKNTANRSANFALIGLCRFIMRFRYLSVIPMWLANSLRLIRRPKFFCLSKYFSNSKSLPLIFTIIFYQFKAEI